MLSALVNAKVKGTKSCMLLLQRRVSDRAGVKPRPQYKPVPTDFDLQPGWLKMPDMKLQDMKLTDEIAGHKKTWKCRTWIRKTRQISY